MEKNDCFPNLVALEYMRSKQLIQVGESLIENSVLSVTCTPGEIFEESVLSFREKKKKKANNLEFYKCCPKYIRCEQEAERSGYLYIP